MSLRCWRCGEPLRRDLPRTFPRLEQCRKCGTDLHVCRMCRHYAPRYISLCAHDTAEPPRDRELANFCQHFRPSPDAFQGSGLDKVDAARKELNAFFGAEAAEDAEPADEEAPTSPNAMDALNALFNDPSKKSDA